MRKLAALLFAFSFSAFAQQPKIGIMPMGGPVPDTQNTQLLTLTNEGDKPIKLQVQTYLWTQAGGQNVLTKTREIVATPGVVEIPPKSKQVLRIARLGSSRYFRVKISELPKPITEKQTGIGFRLEYSIPYLFLPAGAPTPQLTARMVEGALEVSNPGTAPARVTELTTGGKVQDAFWVLPGSAYRVPVAKAASVSLKVNGTATVLSVQ